MIDHTSITVSNYENAKEFYKKTLAPLGYSIAMDIPEYKTCGFGEGDRRDFWISEPGGEVTPSHIAFVAQNESVIEEFFQAGLGAGGRDNGKPGPRTDYGPGYYAAFILDEDGNNIEAVMRNHKG